MAEKRQPWGKWYWGDWRKDARLRRCSYAARGLWADMLSLMGGECDRYGALIMEGQALNADDLAGLLGGSAREIERMLSELETKRVFNRVGDADMPKDITDLIGSYLPTGTIVSRRMVRDAAKADEGRKQIKKRWDSVVDDMELPLEPNRSPNRSPITSESRNQKPESDEESISADLSAEFARWYKVYPRKKAPGAAERAFKKARKIADFSALLAGAERYAAEREGQDPDFTKYPATWLNGQCWRDEAPRPPSARGQNGTVVSLDPEASQQRAAVEYYLRTGKWDAFERNRYGEPPGKPGSRIRPGILVEFRERLTARANTEAALSAG